MYDKRFVREKYNRLYCKAYFITNRPLHILNIRYWRCEIKTYPVTTKQMIESTSLSFSFSKPVTWTIPNQNTSIQFTQHAA